MLIFQNFYTSISIFFKFRVKVILGMTKFMINIIVFPSSYYIIFFFNYIIIHENLFFFTKIWIFIIMKLINKLIHYMTRNIKPIPICEISHVTHFLSIYIKKII